MKILTLILLFLFVATNSFSQRNLLTQYRIHFEHDLKHWANSFRNFKLSEFKLEETRKFEDLPFGDIDSLKEFYSIYKPALSFSPDKIHFIDIYSYWLNLEKKGNKIVATTEVDQAISLCDIKRKEWTRILFCGFSLRIDETKWINNTKFILAGVFPDEHNILHPQIFIGDLIQKKFAVHTNTLGSSKRKIYASVKLKKLHYIDN